MLALYAKVCAWLPRGSLDRQPGQHNQKARSVATQFFPILSRRYRDNPYVVGIDLRNEVHDLHSNPKWGGFMMTWGVWAFAALAYKASPDPSG